MPLCEATRAAYGKAHVLRSRGLLPTAVEVGPFGSGPSARQAFGETGALANISTATSWEMVRQLKTLLS